MTKEPNDSAALLARLQQKTFQYFWTEVNPINGLVVDSTKERPLRKVVLPHERVRIGE